MTPILTAVVDTGHGAQVARHGSHIATPLLMVHCTHESRRVE